MPELTRIIPAGATVNFTSGEYSDFTLHTSGVALKDCDVVATVREWKAQASSFPLDYEFIAWLFGKGGYFAEAPVGTWYIGDYEVGRNMGYDPPEEATNGKA